MRHTDALKRIQAFFRRDDSTPTADVFSGPTLLDQEPDLVQEATRFNIEASAWAAGHSTD